MSWGAVLPWAIAAIAAWLFVRRENRRDAEREQERQARHESEMARIRAEFDRMDAEDAAADAEFDRSEAEAAAKRDPASDPLDEIEAELDYLRGLVAEARAGRVSQTPPPALANPPAAAMVMVPSERA